MDGADLETRLLAARQLMARAASSVQPARERAAHQHRDHADGHENDQHHQQADQPATAKVFEDVHGLLSRRSSPVSLPAPPRRPAGGAGQPVGRPPTPPRSGTGGARPVRPPGARSAPRRSPATGARPRPARGSPQRPGRLPRSPPAARPLTCRPAGPALPLAASSRPARRRIWWVRWVSASRSTAAGIVPPISADG